MPPCRQPFAISVHVCVHACMHVHACVCVYMCRGTPHPSIPTSTHPPPPRAAGSPKHPNSISLELIEILFEDSLPLNTPELIWTIVDHPGHPTHLPHPPQLRKPKLEELQ